MKSITLILLLTIMFASTNVFSQTKREKRYLERLERKEQKGIIYKSDSLPGVRYKKSVRPKTVATIAVIIFVGGAVGRVAFEEFVSPKKH